MIWLEDWAVNDIVPETVDAICVISYGSSKEKLTRGSLAVASLAKTLSYEKPKACIFWGAFSKGEFLKEEIRLKGQFFNPNNTIYIGEVSSTTDECEAMLREINSHGVPKNIVVVAEGAHSRRARLVWKHMAPPGTKVFFVSVQPWDADDPENPMTLQQRWWVWLAVNALLLPFYKWFPGVDWFAKHNFSQPT